MYYVKGSLVAQGEIMNTLEENIYQKGRSAIEKF